MNGKGSKQRPTNHEAFASNYEAVFGKRQRAILEVKTSEISGREYDLMWDEEAEAEEQAFQRYALAVELGE